MNVKIDTKTGVTSPILTKRERSVLTEAAAIVKALGPYDTDKDGEMASEGLSGLLARIDDDGKFSPTAAK